MRSLFQAICNNVGGEEYPPVWMFGLYTNDKINVVIFRNIFSRTIPTMLNIMLHFWNVIVCYWTLPCNTRLPNCRQLQRLVACHLLSFVIQRASDSSNLYLSIPSTYNS